MVCARCGNWVEHPRWLALPKPTPVQTQAYVAYYVNTAGRFWITYCNSICLTALLIRELRQLAAQHYWRVQDLDRQIALAAHAQREDLQELDIADYNPDY